MYDFIPNFIIIVFSVIRSNGIEIKIICFLLYYVFSHKNVFCFDYFKINSLFS